MQMQNYEREAFKSLLIEYPVETRELLIESGILDKEYAKRLALFEQLDIKYFRATFSAHVEVAENIEAFTLEQAESIAEDMAVEGKFGNADLKGSCWSVQYVEEV